MAIESAFASGDFGRALIALMRHEVDFVLCGGVACILHGVSRVTADLDICVAMERDNLLDEAKRREWIEHKGALVYTFVDPDGPLQLDVFLSYPIPYNELRKTAESIPLDRYRLPISSKENLIRAKQSVQPPRTVDARDIEDLRALIERERRERNRFDIAEPED